MGGGDAGDAPGKATGTLSVQATLGETTEPAAPAQRPLPEVDPGAYTVEGEHARGGLGRIVRARDERLERPVAIKELVRPGPSARRRFEREARITARLQHPSVVPIYEAGRWPSGEPFYAMKLVEGRTLRDAIEAAGDLDGRLALLPHVLAVAEAVAFAHSHRVIHRDLKPANVILGSFGETVVIDWGLARDLATPDDDEEGVHGTPAYMAPEQAAGEPVDERTDVWALGALAYHVLTGATPYAGAGDVLAAAREGRPAPVTARQPGVPSDLATIVAKAMARAPADRYAHAGELAADLRRFQTGQLVGAHAYSTWSLIARWARRHRLPLTLAAIFVATLAAVGVTAVRGIVRERNVADARRDELLLLQARGALEKDPTRTLAWLKVYLETGSDRDQVAPLAAEAYQRGVARHVFRGQRGNPFHAVFSPDGKRLATGHADGSVDLWDVTTGASLGHQQHDGWVRAVAFTPDGALVASAADDRRIMLWNPTTHEVRRFAGNTSSVTALAMSPDGKSLASLSDDGAIRIWDVARGSSTTLLARDGMLIAWSPDGSTLASSEEGGALRLWTVDGRAHLLGEHAGGATRLVFAPDGGRLASGGADGKILLWPTQGGPPVSVEGHRGSIEAISFLPDGGMASVARDGDLRLWDPRGAALATVTAGTELQALAVSRDGRLIAYGGQDGVVRVRDGDTQAVRELHGHGSAVYKLAFSPDGTMLASVGGEVRLWDMVSREVIPTRVLTGHTDDVSAVAFSPDGATIATASRDRSVRLWSAGGELQRELLGHEHMVYRVAFVPGGRWLASASLDRTVRLWDLAGGQARVLVGPTDGLWDLAVSPDGTRVAAAGMGPDVWIWTVDDATGRPLRGHAGEVRSIAFSPDGARLASGGADRTVRLWDVATGEGRVLGSHEDQVERVVFSPSGKLVASAGREGRVRIWDLASGRARVLSAEQGALRHVAFSPDGATLASAGADGTVALWDLASGGHRLLRGHTKLVAHIIFSPDGTRLASVSIDGVARLWDLAVAQTRVLPGHRGAVLRAAFSPDGTKLATASTDRTARVFTLPPRPLVPIELDALRAFLVEATSARVGSSDVLATPQDF